MSEQQSSFKASKELLDLRKREILLVKMKEYETAEKMKKKADQLEYEEKFKHDIWTGEKINRTESVLKKKHRQGMEALLGRIQRDRRE